MRGTDIRLAPPRAIARQPPPDGYLRLMRMSLSKVKIAMSAAAT
jgi:hypothetical protein